MSDDSASDSLTPSLPASLRLPSVFISQPDQLASQCFASWASASVLCCGTSLRTARNLALRSAVCGVVRPHAPCVRVLPRRCPVPNLSDLKC